MCKSIKTGKWHLFHCWHRTAKKVSTLAEGYSCESDIGKKVELHLRKCCRCGKEEEYIDSIY